MSFALRHWIGRADALPGRVPFDGAEDGGHDTTRGLTEPEREHADALARAAQQLAAPHGPEAIISLEAASDGLTSTVTVRLLPAPPIVQSSNPQATIAEVDDGGSSAGGDGAAEPGTADRRA